MTAPVQYLELGSAGFARYADESVEVYTVAMQRPAEIAPQRRAMLARHLTYVGFLAFVALAPDGALAGFGYSYPGRPGQWWHDSVFRALRTTYSREVAAGWLGDSREVVELHVLPAYQGQGIGRALLRKLVDGSEEPTIVLSTHDRESAARVLYRSMGFVDLLTDYRFPGGVERYAVMGLDRRRA